MHGRVTLPWRFGEADWKLAVLIGTTTLWTFTTYCFLNTVLELLCHPLYLRLQNQRSWPLSCLYLSQTNTFVNSIATLFQHVFKQNVEDMYFYLSLFLPGKENSDVKGSSVCVDATPAATRERCRAAMHLQRRLLLYTQYKVVFSGRLHRDKYRSVCMPLS